MQIKYENIILRDMIIKLLEIKKNLVNYNLKNIYVRILLDFCKTQKIHRKISAHY